MHTVLPKLDANLAAVRPADPPPITMRSYVDAGDVFEEVAAGVACSVMRFLCDNKDGGAKAFSRCSESKYVMQAKAFMARSFEVIPSST